MAARRLRQDVQGPPWQQCLWSISSESPCPEGLHGTWQGPWFRVACSLTSGTGVVFLFARGAELFARSPPDAAWSLVSTRFSGPRG
eukprot:1303346-Pyramimonas_sp.AAC.1